MWIVQLYGILVKTVAYVSLEVYYLGNVFHVKVQTVSIPNDIQLKDFILILIYILIFFYLF